MNPEMEEDLGRWEAGAITLRELQGRHPDADVTALTELHSRVTLLGREPTPEPSRGWRELRARLPERTGDFVAIDRPRRARHGARRVAVLGLAAVLTLGGGLAMAGALPAPAQKAVADVLGHLGVQLPHAEQAPPAGTHGAEVSHLAHTTSTTGCEKGQAIAAAASANAAGHRRDPSRTVDPCGRTRVPGRPTGGHGSDPSPHGGGPGKAAGPHAGAPGSGGGGPRAGKARGQAVGQRDDRSVHPRRGEGARGVDRSSGGTQAAGRG